MSIKRATLRACGGDVLAAWALDTLRWASERTGPEVPWTTARLSEVSGLSYDQSKKAVRRLRDSGLISTRRGCIKVEVDLSASGHCTPLDGGTVPHTSGALYPAPTYTWNVVTSCEGSHMFNSTEDEEATPSPKTTPKTSPDSFRDKKTTAQNLRRVWQALNVEAGRRMNDHAVAKSWAAAGGEQRLRADLGERGLGKVVDVYRRWEEWRAYVRAEVGMTAPKVPMMWHVAQNVSLIDGFLQADEDDWGISEDDWETSGGGDADEW